jgi:hypothetical protein
MKRGIRQFDQHQSSPTQWCRCHKGTINRRWQNYRQIRVARHCARAEVPPVRGIAVQLPQALLHTDAWDRTRTNLIFVDNISIVRFEINPDSIGQIMRGMAGRSTKSRFNASRAHDRVLRDVA